MLQCGTTTNEQLKIELLIQWKLEAEFRNQGSPFSFWLLSRTEAGLSQTVKDYKTTLLPSLLIMILIKMTRSTCPMLKRASALVIMACVVKKNIKKQSVFLLWKSYILCGCFWFFFYCSYCNHLGTELVALKSFICIDHCLIGPFHSDQLHEKIYKWYNPFYSDLLQQNQFHVCHLENQIRILTEYEIDKNSDPFIAWGVSLNAWSGLTVMIWTTLLNNEIEQWKVFHPPHPALLRCSNTSRPPLGWFNWDMMSTFVRHQVQEI